MAIIIRGGEKALGTGDSITAGGYLEVAGGLFDQIDAKIPTVTGPRFATAAAGSTPAVAASGSTRAIANSVSTHNTIRRFNTGIAGNLTGDIAAAVPARITNLAPDVLILLIGINDVINGMSLAAYSTPNMNTILSQTRAFSSTMQILLVSLLCYGELWAAGPPLSWGPNAPQLLDGPIDAFNVMLQGMCSTYNCTYADARAQLLVWESINNAPAPGVQAGPFAGGGPHPLIPTGQVVLSNFLIGSFQVG
jgi:hypothetical protein